MKKIFLTFFVLGLTISSTMAGMSVGVDNEKKLPVIEPPPMNYCEQKEIKDIKDSAKINSYDNTPIFNKDKKVNIMLKQPNAYLGTQQ